LGPALAVLSSGLRYSRQAVLLFFLISGFCVHYRQARELAVVRAPGALRSPAATPTAEATAP
jgi:hypothetical protein